jgi:glycosyltransferase involved in cell wall biosynthesis
MKILIATGIYPPSIGGPATYSKLLNDELPSHNIAVEVLSFDQVRHLPKVVRHIAYFFKVLGALRKCDLVYAQDPVSVGLPAVIAAKILGKPLVLKVVGDYAWEQGTQRYGVEDLLDVFVTKDTYVFQVKVMKYIQSFVARHAKKIIVPSRYLKRIVTAWGVPGNKVTVIYNAFSPVPLEATKEELKIELNIPGNIIVSIGRLVPWKGFTTLISLMPSIVAKFPLAELLIIGTGPQKYELIARIKQEKMEKHVRIIDALPKVELLKYLKASDVFVLNTAYEGFSHQLLEALAVQTPVITTNVGGNPELITHEVDGILVEYNDKENILSAIEKILHYKVIGATFAQEGNKKLQEFSKERMLNDLIHTFKAL